VHGFHVEEEWTGSFIVLGTTGSGKTTLIKYVNKMTDSTKLPYVELL
jgi:type IV secretory pathway VirB4 component